MKKSLLAVTVFLCSAMNVHAESALLFATKDEQMKVASMAVTCATVGGTLQFIGKTEEGAAILERFSYPKFKDLTPLMSEDEWRTIVHQEDKRYEDTPENRKILESRKEACISIANDLGII